jgi:hypothetical protein
MSFFPAKDPVLGDARLARAFGRGDLVPHAGRRGAEGGGGVSCY